MKRIIKGRPGHWLRHPATFVLPALVIVAACASAPASAAAAGLRATTGTTASPGPSSSMCPGATVAAFGPNVCVFNDTMSQATIQADLNSIANQQVPVASQFDSQRYAVLFQPGTYGSAADPPVFQVGSYNEVAGLGSMPPDT